MDTANVLYLFLILFLILYITVRYFLRKLQNLPPSPLLTLPLIGHLYLLKKPFQKSLSQLSKKYGPILSLQLGTRPILLISSPSLAEECFTNNDVIFANRPSFLNGKHFGYNFTSLPWCPYGDHWRNLRKIATLELLSAYRLQMLSNVRKDEIITLIRKINKMASGREHGVVEVKTALFEFTFNLLTGMICGKRYYGKDIENSKQAAIFQDIVEETSKVGPATSIVDIMPFMRWFGYKDTEKKIGVIQKKRDLFMQSLVEEYKEMETNAFASPPEESKTMAHILLSLQKQEPEYYTDEMIRNLLLVLIQAGSNTSADTLEWAFTLLLANPHVITRAQAEIDSVVGKVRLVNESDIAQLPYLRGIIDETLRLHPSAPLLMPHQSSADCVVGRFFVPKGTILLVNVWDIHHNSEFWEDAEKFKPERFQEFERSKNDCKFMPFGSGRRACPGENLALRIVTVALGSLIQCFDWEKIGDIDMRERSGGIVAPKFDPLICNCNPRPFLNKLLSDI